MALGHLLLIGLVGLSSAQEAWPFSMWRNSALKLRKAFNPTEALPKFYHTTQEITQELDKLQGSCKGLKLEKKAVGTNNVDVVRFDPSEKASYRTMIVAGEHARELIGAETALDLVKELCRGSEQTKAAVKDTEFMIIINANPGSRMKVENGEFCLRVNPSGVDINRNWDTEWNEVDMGQNVDTNPGPKAWSEPETRLLRDLMHEFKPHTFLDVHSGNLGLYLPNKLSDARPHAKQVQKLLVDINEKNCKCPLGMANEEVGYQTCGSSLDYSYSKVGSKFAIAMEVWVDPSRMQDLRETWSSQKQLLQTPAASSFLQTGELPNKPMFIESEAHSDSIENELQKKGPGFCFGFFNPDEKSQYDRTVSKWTTTLLELTSAARNVPERPRALSLKQLPIDEPEAKHHFPLPLKIGAGMLFVLLLGWGASRMMRLYAGKTVEAEPLVQRAMGQIQVHD